MTKAFEHSCDRTYVEVIKLLDGRQNILCNNSSSLGSFSQKRLIADFVTVV